jgi:hypothetical protein
VLHAGERGQRDVQHAGRAHAGVGHHQRLRHARGPALLRQQAHGAGVDLDLGDVLEAGHGGLGEGEKTV